MPFFDSMTHRMLRGGASRRLARAIPNPIVRYAAVTAVSALIPALIAALAKRRSRRY